MDESGHLRVLRVVHGFAQHARIAVEPEEHGTQTLRPGQRTRLRFLMQCFPQHRIVTAPAEKAEIIAAQAGCDVRRHQRRLDQQRARTAHRIDKAAAGRIHRGPARTQEHAGGQIFLERRQAFAEPVAALMQRRTGQVDAQDRLPFAQDEIDAHRRRLGVHVRTLAAAFAELIDDCVFHAQRGELRVRDAARTADRVDRKGVGGAEMLAPVDLVRAAVQIVTVGDGKLRDRHQHAARQPRPQTGAIACVEPAAEMHAGECLVHLARAECLQLVDEQIFEPFRARGEEFPRRRLRRVQANRLKNKPNWSAM